MMLGYIDNAGTVVYMSGTQYISASIIMDDVSCTVRSINELIQYHQYGLIAYDLISLLHCR